jgi:chromosome segregation ATPase
MIEDTMLNRFRRRFDAAVATRVDARMDARIEEASATMERAQRDYEARLGGNQADFSYLRSEFDRIAPQVAALEQRFERLRNQLDLTGADPEDALVRAQAEHERARIRLELASHYEERLRRLEAESD